jgi:hypothetical protein
MLWHTSKHLGEMRDGSGEDLSNNRDGGKHHVVTRSVVGTLEWYCRLDRADRHHYRRTGLLPV